MNIRMAVSALGTLLVSMLIACGGGSGGGQQSRNAVLSLSDSTLTVAAREDQSAPSDRSVVISLRNLPDDGLFVELEFSDNGISSADFFQSSESAASMELLFKTPSTLGRGSYTDQVRVTACYDESCNERVSGSPALLQVTYIVEPVTTMTLDRSTVFTGATVGGQPPPLESIRVSFDVVPPRGVFASLEVEEFSSTASIESAELVELSPTERRIDIRWKDPDELGESDKGARISVDACYDNPCTDPVVNGKQSFNTVYRVSRLPISSARRFDLGARDMVFDPVAGLIYLALPSTAPAHPGTLAAFDPIQGQITASVTAGGEPRLVAVSDDGSLAYVGLSGVDQIRRFSAPALTPDLSINLPPLTGPPDRRGPEQIAVAPGAPRTLAVSDEGAVTIYDDATLRNGASGPRPANTVVWGATDHILYSSNNENTSFDFWVLDVGPLGVQTRAGYSGLLNGFSPRIHHADGLVYSELGAAIDPVAGRVAGTFLPPTIATESFRRLALDPPARLAFIARRNSPDPAYVRRIEVFDLDSYASLRTFELLDVQGDPRRLLRWGNDGMALLTTTGQLVLFQGALVSGPASP